MKPEIKPPQLPPFVEVLKEKEIHLEIFFFFIILLNLQHYLVLQETQMTKIPFHPGRLCSSHISMCDTPIYCTVLHEISTKNIDL